MNVFVFKHHFIVDIADAIYRKCEVREEFELVESIHHQFFERFTLNRVAVASFKFFRHWVAADEAVVWYFVKVWLWVDVVELFDVVHLLQTQISPMISMSVDAVHDRVLNTKIKYRLLGS